MENSKPLVVAVDMGYGHLRAAYAIAEALQVPVFQSDMPPLAEGEERKIWQRGRGVYEFVSRSSQLPYIGGPFRTVLNALTFIPELHPYRDLSASNWVVRSLDKRFERGLGQGLIKKLRASNAPLMTTFYAPALGADRAGCESVYCLVTDADIHRIWAPLNPAQSKIQYFAPSQRALRRLIAYGIPKERVQLTGFPLPEALLGGPELPVLRQNLAARLRRLDPERVFIEQYKYELKQFLGELSNAMQPEPPLLTFAVGGAGAQSGIVEAFLPGIGELIREGKIKLALVAGIRKEVAQKFLDLIREAKLESFLGREVRILCEPDFPSYYSSFNQLLAETDILWTKPSELTFYAALGIPIIFSWPVGHHEKCNRRWAIENGAGLKQGNPRYAADWISDWLSDGTLAAAAWSGFMRLPKFGTYRIREALLKSKPSGDELAVPASSVYRPYGRTTD